MLMTEDSGARPEQQKADPTLVSAVCVACFSRQQMSSLNQRRVREARRPAPAGERRLAEDTCGEEGGDSNKQHTKQQATG